MQNKVEQVPEAPNHWINSEAWAWQSGYATALEAMHNEYAALNAVAEAAFEAKEGGYSQAQHDLLCEALATLQSIRKGPKV